MSKSEKLVQLGSFVVLIVGIILKALIGYEDMGVFMILAFAGILLWVCLAVAAFFPADWRMTERQRQKIGDMDSYQAKYRKILIGVNLVLTIGFMILILVIG